MKTILEFINSEWKDVEITNKRYRELSKLENDDYTLECHRMSSNGIFTCTRLKHDDNLHVAHGINKDVVAIWES